jgi:Mn2+/Fe2+ NRAMP family transporter
MVRRKELHTALISKVFWRDEWKYFGPALIVSVAYIDPGNYGTDISGGATFG